MTEVPVDAPALQKLTVAFLDLLTWLVSWVYPATGKQVAIGFFWFCVITAVVCVAMRAWMGWRDYKQRRKNREGS